MDKVDEKILAILKKNARTRVSHIAREIHLSETSVIDHIKKMENSGVIKQYTTVIDYEKVGMDISAFTYVRVEHPKYNEEFIKHMQEHPEVAELHYITGDYDFILKIVTKSSSSLQRVLNDIKCAPGVSLTRSNVVLSTCKNNFTSVFPADTAADGASDKGN